MSDYLTTEKAAEVPARSAESYLTVERAAEYLGCKPKRIYELIAQGRVRHYRIGRRILFRREDLDAALEVHEARA